MNTSIIYYSAVNRNKILGEESEEQVNEDLHYLTESKQDRNREKTVTLQYMNIRRQRPTTEGPPISKYTEIRRRTTESNDDKNEDTTLK